LNSYEFVEKYNFRSQSFDILKKLKLN